MLVEGVEQLVAPDQGAPERCLALAVAPDQHPLRQDGKGRSRERAAQVEERKEQQRVQEIERVVEEQQRRKQQTDQDDEAGRRGYDAYEFDSGALHAQLRGRVERGLLRERRAL